MVSKSSKKITYREFVSKEIPRLRNKHPNLQNTDYMKLAAKLWKKHKLEHGIKTAVVKAIKVKRAKSSGSKTVRKAKSKTYKSKSKSRSKSGSKTTRTKSKSKSKAKSKSRSKSRAK